MIRNDYIMRQIELLGAFVSKLLKRIDEDELDEASTDADEASRQFVGLPLIVLENQPPDGFEGLLSMGDQFDYMRGLAAATLLEMRGKLAAADGDETTAFRLWTNATALLIRCHESADQQVQTMCSNRLEIVLTALQEYEIPEFLHRALTTYYEKNGDIARAEDHLFHAVQSGQPEVFDWARSFYTRIAALDDVQLSKGTFSRSEIDEGLAELNRISGQRGVNEIGSR